MPLSEPFDMLHYVARKLKADNLISFYRLDENGYSWISMGEDKQFFKFTSVQQLDTIGINLPDRLKEELRTNNTRRLQREKEQEERNIARAAQPRQAPPSARHVVDQQAVQPPPTRPSVTGSNAVPQGGGRQHNTGVRSYTPLLPRPRLPATPTTQPPRSDFPPLGNTRSLQQNFGARNSETGGYYTAPPPGQPLGNSGLSRHHPHDQYQLPPIVNPYASDLERKAVNLGREMGVICENEVGLGFGLFDN